MNNAIEFLNRLARELKEQDNAYTTSPIYCIQEEVTVIGLDPAYCDETGWFDGDANYQADERKARVLERYYRRYYGREPDGWVRAGFRREWQYTGRAYLTRAAAHAFVGNSKKYRVCVDSAFRNHELKEIRRLLAGPLAQCVQALQLADGFITSGIERGYIQMPDADDLNPAHTTPDAIKTALALLETAREPHA